MATCSSCSYDNRSGAKRCGGCGSPLMDAGVGSANPVVAPQQPAGNLNPTISEDEGPAAPPAGIRSGGAVASTIFEGGAGGPASSRKGPNRTVIEEEEARPLAGWLVVLRSRADIAPYTEIPLYMGKNVLGRLNVLGPDKNISEEHALVIGSDENAQLTDMGSSNGTSVNNEQVDSHTLARGDMVRMGKTTMVFVPMVAKAAS